MWTYNFMLQIPDLQRISSYQKNWPCKLFVASIVKVFLADKASDSYCAKKTFKCTAEINKLAMSDDAHSVFICKSKPKTHSHRPTDMDQISEVDIFSVFRVDFICNKYFYNRKTTTELHSCRQFVFSITGIYIISKMGNLSKIMKSSKICSKKLWQSVKKLL